MSEIYLGPRGLKAAMLKGMAEGGQVAAQVETVSKRDIERLQHLVDRGIGCDEITYGLYGEDLPTEGFRPAVTSGSAHFVDQVSEVLAESEKLA